MNPVIERLALVVYALVESDEAYDLNNGEGLSYAEACNILGLTNDEKHAVLALIDADLATN